VYAAYHRSAADIERLTASLREASGAVHPRQGDGSDMAWCRSMVREIVRTEGQLDVLVCNASPAILPMSFGEHSAQRIDRYVADSLALVSHPLAAAIECLAAHQGSAVAISSIFANTEKPQLARARATYPHYVSAKCAIEGLVHSAAAAYPGVRFLIARPPRLEAELRLPSGDGAVLPASQVASMLIRRLAMDRPAGAAVVMEDFCS